jgi:tetratricopeptide (TPR) repeat protein
MIRVFILLFFLLLFFNCAVQKKSKYVPPRYKGGNKEAIKYLQNYITYPSICYERGIQELIITQIRINTKGEISSVETKGVNLQLQFEVKRAVYLMPDWIPGKLNRKKTDTIVEIPINFVIGHQDKRLKSAGDTAFINVFQVPLTGINDSLATQRNLEMLQREMARKFMENGIEFSANKEYQKAIEYFNMAIKYDDSDKKEIYYHRGNVYYKLEQTNKACIDWLEAYRHNYSYAAEAYQKNCKGFKP